MIKLFQLIIQYKQMQRQVDSIYKSVTKMGKYVEDLNKEVATIKKNIPLDINDRVSVIEGFIDNVEKITTEYNKEFAN
tara:strand:+ start:105 stop:338 length:234 start_codon:yes stop_codon:yes gene_type:complete